MRKYGKIDANQHSIVKALESVGATVQSLGSLGDGVPDLLVGFRGKNFIIELKSSPQAKLTKKQESFFAKWKGQVNRANNIEEAFNIIGVIE